MKKYDFFFASDTQTGKYFYVWPKQCEYSVCRLITIDIGKKQSKLLFSTLHFYTFFYNSILQVRFSFPSRLVFLFMVDCFARTFFLFFVFICRICTIYLLLVCLYTMKPFFFLDTDREYETRCCISIYIPPCGI